MNMISRSEAMKMGMKRYFTGNACSRGHVSERLVSTRSCIQCVNERVSLYKKRNAEKCREWRRDWNRRNPDKVNLMQRNNYAKSESRRTKHAQLVKSWAVKNRGSRASYEAKRRALKQKATPAWANLDEIKEVYERAAYYRSLGMNMDVDHVVPLNGKTVCGLHVHENLQIIHERINQSKSNTFI